MTIGGQKIERTTPKFWRVVLALFGTPIISSLILFVYLFMLLTIVQVIFSDDAAGHIIIEMFILGFATTVLFGYPILIIFGVPFYILLNGRFGYSIIPAIIAGCLSTLFPCFLLVAFSLPHINIYYTTSLAVFPIAGCIGGLTFWLTAICGDQQLTHISEDNTKAHGSV